MLKVLLRTTWIQLVLIISFILPVNANPTPHETDNSPQLLKLEDTVLLELNEEEKSWYIKFKEGVLFFDGWNTISNKILSVFPVEAQEEKRASVQRLGIKIGTEWCRENEIRKINTNMLKAWGSRIREAVDLGALETETVLKEIETEVDLILQSDGGSSLVTSES